MFEPCTKTLLVSVWTMDKSSWYSPGEYEDLQLAKCIRSSSRRECNIHGGQMEARSPRKQSLHLVSSGLVIRLPNRVMKLTGLSWVLTLFRNGRLSHHGPQASQSFLSLDYRRHDNWSRVATRQHNHFCLHLVSKLDSSAPWHSTSRDILSVSSGPNTKWSIQSEGIDRQR